jgi:hypothetical protein
MILNRPSRRDRPLASVEQKTFLNMVREHRIQRTADLALARQEAHRFQTTQTPSFQQVPSSVLALEEQADSVVERRSDQRQSACEEIVQTKESAIARIGVHASPARKMSRYAAAHQLGHAILLNKYSNDVKRWDSGRREVFASAFAAELLTLPETRARTSAAFRTLADPLSLFKLASQMGLSPIALLTVATQERSWTEGLDKVWLRVSCIENVFTRRGLRWRIVSAYYDKSRFYIPTNQVLARFAGDDGWLDSLSVGAMVHHRAAIRVKLRQPPPAMPKLLSKQVSAGLSAMRLQPSAPDPVTQLIILADMTPPGPSEGDSVAGASSSTSLPAVQSH